MKKTIKLNIDGFYNQAWYIQKINQSGNKVNYFHRENGPAVITKNGSIKYFYDGFPCASIEVYNDIKSTGVFYEFEQ